ncbi:MAG: hypothetical protein KC912_24730 [Proteobacteria bacterium]|nr:hypothetical protein [Pseudomonadota bacterium]
MMLALLTALALAATSSVDLDGDGKNETIEVSEDTLRVGNARVDCGGYTACEVTPTDVKSSDNKKELLVCEHGPRDDQYCRLYRYDGRMLKELPFEGEEHGQSKIIINGSGIVRTSQWAHRLYTRVDKWTLDGDKLVRTPQPMYGANETFRVAATFQLKLEPNAKSKTIANTKPDSDIVLLAEHGTHEGWFLVMLSSNITGWVHQSTLAESSEQYQLMLGAG